MEVIVCKCGVRTLEAGVLDHVHCPPTAVGDPVGFSVGKTVGARVGADVGVVSRRAITPGEAPVPKYNVLLPTPSSIADV